MKISVIGLGKLGATTLAVLASKGFEVIGIDINKETVDMINKGIPPVYEPGLKELLSENLERITATMDPTKIAETDMTIIIVPTPSTEEGGFSTEYVEKAILEIGRNIPSKKEYHNVVVTSTVLPGSMETIIKPLLERTSNRRVGDKTVSEKIKINGEDKIIKKKPIGLCYNPDFIALGDIINGLLKPDMVLIGESDEKAGDMIEQMHNGLTWKRDTHSQIVSYAPIHRMSLYNAELAKISLNAYITMKISFANTIAEICEGMPTGNSEQVLQAIGSDRRVGKEYLRGGLSYSGPCFPRDNRAFMFTATKYGSQSLISQMVDLVNTQQIERMVTYILKALSEVGTNKLSVLGLTYKPGTVVTEESASLKIIQKLLREGIEIAVYDPAPAYVDLPMISGLVFSKSIPQVLLHAEVCFIATPWDQFKTISKEMFLNCMKEKPTIIDAWGIQSQLQYDSDFDYREIGRYYDRHI